jgi:isocitrate/isopropylmalate dehydrogenase
MSPSATSHKHSIATIGADGIGPEVVEAGVQVLRKLAELDGTFALEFKDYDWSSDTYKKTGQYIPDGGLEELKKHNAILFGAVGAPGTLHHSASSMSNLLTILQTCPTTSPSGTSV